MCNDVPNCGTYDASDEKECKINKLHIIYYSTKHIQREQMLDAKKAIDFLLNVKSKKVCFCWRWEIAPRLKMLRDMFVQYRARPGDNAGFIKCLRFQRLTWLHMWQEFSDLQWSTLVFHLT
jgi:hypothetical protein